MATKQLFRAFTTHLGMGGMQGDADTDQTAGKITTGAIFGSLLLVFSSALVGVGAGVDDNSRLNSTSPLAEKIGIEDQAELQRDYATIVEYFYETLEQEGAQVDFVCVEEGTVATRIHVKMERTDDMTRFADAELITAVYVQGTTEFPEAFRSIDRVSIEWPSDGGDTKRTMYISGQWVEEYQREELSGTEFVQLVALTESTYNQPYQPGDQATCHPETASATSTTTSSTTVSPEISEWTLVEGNETEIQAAEPPSKASIVSELLNTGVPADSYRTAGDTLQIEIESADRDERFEHAMYAALIFAQSREQGYNVTNRLLMWWPTGTDGLYHHMYIQVEWADKYLEGEWSKEEYFAQVLATEGSS